ncbi:MAG: BlaI/MecI/CopY family transcriptional regulator [Planctomycetaceae bacterium]|nr:BlaI/MecI/CopY family transcriptional regulator [Planctomycetaceae bacterium]
MPRQVSKYPTELELQILKTLWRQSPLLAREVQSALAEDGRALAKTSVITTLNTMFRKRYLTRKKQNNTYLFSPRITEEQVNGLVIEDVVDRVFDGSTAAVLLSLFDAKEIQRDELQELRLLIDRRLKETR